MVLEWMGQSDAGEEAWKWAGCKARRSKLLSYNQRYGNREGMSHEKGIDSDLAPLVVVEGFLGDPGLGCWHHLIECQARRRLVISVRLGAMSSVHDRCCELFYQIKGGRVDYGEQHAVEMGHGRFGLEYAGAYPQWSAEHPVHFLGHSLGGLTVWHLQQMLQRNEFGFQTNADWVRSLGTFSAPLRGTTTTYIMGCCEGKPSTVRSWTVGGILYCLAYLLAWLNWTILHMVMFDPSLAHWDLDKHSILELAYNIYTGLRFDGGRDNAAYDLSVEVAEALNKDAVTFPTTYYRSYAVSMTSPCMSLFHVDEPTKRPPLVVLVASLMGGFTFQSLPYPSENWRDNDGVVPVISQCHPGDCR
ncbi:hypothetical protein DSO57_1015366 [Entomophthora muscae]|uniref:Uncharacterized protein n=1 Tax=Entomophthora muscae TaxID=34485 RepID=A0ACC2S733_9FUNG|nr:hypothetical protein DSO57_1015366 [Entomophthora muscae]